MCGNALVTEIAGLRKALPARQAGNSSASPTPTATPQDTGYVSRESTEPQMAAAGQGIS